MNKRKLKIYFQTKTDFLDNFLQKGSLTKERAGQTRTDRSNGDGGGDASMSATTPVRRRCRYIAPPEFEISESRNTEL